MTSTFESLNPAGTQLINASPMRRSEFLPPISKLAVPNSQSQFNDQTKTAQMHVYRSLAAKNTQKKTNGNGIGISRSSRLRRTNSWPPSKTSAMELATERTTRSGSEAATINIKAEARNRLTKNYVLQLIAEELNELRKQNQNITFEQIANVLSRHEG